VRRPRAALRFWALAAAPPRSKDTDNKPQKVLAEQR
jgi:hypothetical protein